MLLLNFLLKSSISTQIYEAYFNPFLNYQRVCAFATDYTDKKGKIRKKYDTYLTPYEKLKSLDNSAQYLKKGITFAKLDEIAYSESDIKAGEIMKKEKSKVFKKLGKLNKF